MTSLDASGKSRLSGNNIANCPLPIAHYQAEKTVVAQHMKHPSNLFISRMLICSLFLIGLQPAFSQSAPQKLNEKIASVINANEYRISSWGIAVADAATGEMIYELNPNKLFVPGSVTKLFSGAAALITFGADHRFVTPIHRRGEIDANGILHGDLILQASGDPDLSGRANAQGQLEFTNHDHTYSGMYVSQGASAELTKTDALAGIDDFAQQISAAGIKQINDVLIDERLFERHESGGSPPFQVTPIVVNDHLIDITIAPNNEAGMPAKIELRPNTNYVQFDVAVNTAAAGGGSYITLQKVAPNRFALRGQIAKDKPPTVRTVEVENAAEFARAVLIERLQARGVRVEASIYSAPKNDALPAESEYEKFPIVAKHTSSPFAESLKVILKVSHNNHAHMLPLLIAAKNGKRAHTAGMRAEGEALKSIGVDISAFSLGDGEGGEQGDQVSPRGTIQLLRAMAKRPDYQFFHDALPALGVDGTLADAVPPTSPARGKAYAKTGTYVWGDALNGRPLLRGKGFGGYITAASGRKLVVAIFLNNVPMKVPADTNKHGATLGKLAEIIYEGL